MKRFLTIFLFALSLTACTTYFGLSKEQWESLTPAQQADVMKAYNEREAARQRAKQERELIAEQNAPLNNLIGVLGTAVPNKSKQRSKTTTNRQCNADGTHCTSKSTTRSSGWQLGY